MGLVWWGCVYVINKHTAKLHHVGSLYILTYDARKLKHKIYQYIVEHFRGVSK